MVLAVFVHHVIDHLLTAFIVEVRVDIGHALAIRIQEPFEEQVVLDRVDVCDSRAIGHHAAGCTSTTGADQHAHGLSRVDEILCDQEVSAETHGADREQLEIDTLLDLEVE